MPLAITIPPANPAAAPGVTTLTFPNRVRLGPGARRELAGELARLGVRRPLLVTDPGLVAAGVAAEAASGVEGAVTFSAVQANPAEEDVLAGLEAYRENGCDGLVAV